MAEEISTNFEAFNEHLSKEQDKREEIRTIVRELEQTGREIMTVLNAIHQGSGIKEVPQICKRSRELFQTVRSKIALLAAAFPVDEYYRFHDHWKYGIQRLAFSASLIIFLEHERLATREEVAELLGVTVKKSDGFHIDLEDFLHGVLSLGNELSRLAVNSVTSGDYSRPIRISAFMGELNSGFRLLNLKNDSLRKRFDGLKYDIKKIEEVVYDISIRGLRPAALDAKADPSVETAAAQGEK
ncbi:translin isoform X1 [Strongylocentrotus purpuratus]|uniref:Translin n=2 Tax=Strongylocentrotus purpuratus TaxID=7668 RepID=A0A7M7TGB1_STRPU|nr:translin isoform X1 [Strongylocentrotus purpuratus]|eukprot:XP_781342.2 PREDICTED: translin isoform X1 [Strongylocentrotus purpuratus]